MRSRSLDTRNLSDPINVLLVNPSLGYRLQVNSGGTLTSAAKETTFDDRHHGYKSLLKIMLSKYTTNMHLAVANNIVGVTKMWQCSI